MDPRKRHLLVTGIGGFLGLPKSALVEIERSYKSWAKRKEAWLDTYVHHHPCPSWKKISELLKRYSLEQQAGEVEETYIQVSERTQHYFDIAMKGGTLMIRNGGIFFLGPGGSGKTCTLHALLLEPPPSVRQSTPCAKRTVRTIAQCKVGVEGVYFIRIQDDQYSDMLSTTAKQLQPQPPSISTATPTPAEEEATSREDASVPSPASVSQHIEEADPHTTKQEENPNVGPEKKQKKPTSRRSGFEKELLRRMQLVPKRSENLIDKDLLDMKDSGGQPMFHEVLPLFVKNTTFGVLTVKLNERLDSYPMVDYYSDGKPVGEPFPSPFTHLQTFRHCMRVLQSTCSEGTCPKLVFIGTHKDLEQECPGENREEKNRNLRSIIPPDLKQSILYYEYSNEELLFGVNVKAPKDIDRKMIGCVRERMIKELRKLPQQKIPLQYFALENAFLRLAKYQHKGVLSKEDCFQEAAAYHFTKESFEAALQYLHGLKLIFYYKEVLPDVVFIDAQTILDKITELVEFSLCSQSKPVYELTISDSMDINLKEFQQFKAYGIVTLELLSQFSSHYVPGLFMQQQLALLLEYLRVIAKVGNGKYLMPCLLRVSPIPRPLPHSSNPSISALLFYFGPNGAKLGVYCFLLASLITDAKWKLMAKNDRPVQVSRNQVQFRLPGDNPGAITITDSFSTSFHVSIDFPEDMEADESLQISSRICPGIRETILSSVQKVSHRLNYSNSIPTIAFPCTKHLPDAIHPATISSTGFLTCTIDPEIYSRLTEQHRIWLREEPHADIKGVDQSQILNQVIDSGHSGVPRHLGQIAETMYEWEGALADSLGLHQADVAEIKEAHSGKLKLQARAALEKWKQYNGSRATYRKLIAAFEQAGRKDFASKVYEIAGVPSTVTEVKIESGQAKAHIGAQKKHESATMPPEGGKKPQLAKAFKILIPIAEEWQNIGTLLELEDDALTSIAAAGKKDTDRLREMLKLWISQEDSVPSWEALAEAVEPFSGEVVAKVKSQCA